MSSNEIDLRIGRDRFRDWTSVRITRTMEALADSFTFSFADTKINPANPVLDIEEGDSCEIRIDGDKILVGNVDDVTIGYSATAHRINVSGRSKTGDLVDSSAIYKTGKWRNRTLIQMAKNLCDPFGIIPRFAIGVTDAEKFEKFRIEHSETVFSTLTRMADARGLLMVTDELGNLVFTRVGQNRATTPITNGPKGNVISGQRIGSWKERFSFYVIKTQIPGTDQFFGPQAASPEFSVIDTQVDRYRPRLIAPRSGTKASQMKNKATFERNVRAGKSRKFVHAVQGWNDGPFLWEPNRLVTIDDPFLKLSAQELLISTVTYTKDKSGTFANISTVDKRTFDILEQPKPRRKAA